MSANDIRLAEVKIKAKYENQIKSKPCQLGLNTTQHTIKKGTGNNITQSTTQNVNGVILHKQSFEKPTQDQCSNKALTQFLGFMSNVQTK